MPYKWYREEGKVTLLGATQNMLPTVHLRAQSSEDQSNDIRKTKTKNKTKQMTKQNKNKNKTEQQQQHKHTENTKTHKNKKNKVLLCAHV